MGYSVTLTEASFLSRQFDNYQKRETLFLNMQNYLKENIKKHIKLNDLCREFGINRNKVIFVFRSCSDQTPFEWLRLYRLNVAKELLKAYHDAPVYLIAHEVGYDDPNNFSTAFKKQFGCSPARYRTTKG